MQDPAGLYQLNPDITDVPEGLHLVAGLTGFADAGAAVSQFTDSLHATLTTRALATFDADILLDYRARRPIIYFDQDHLTDYQPATLALYLANDEVGHRSYCSPDSSQTSNGTASPPRCCNWSNDSR